MAGAERMIWGDNFPYANDAALEAAYPSSESAGVTSVEYCSVVTPGPPGFGTGLRTTAGHFDRTAKFHASHRILGAPATRYFHVRATWKNDTINADGDVDIWPILALEWQLPGVYLGTFWSLWTHVTAPTELRLAVNGGDGTFGSNPDPAFDTGMVAGALSPNQSNRIDVWGQISSVSENPPGSGVYTANPDGLVTVTVNGHPFTHWAGVVWAWETQPPYQPADPVRDTMHWNLVEVWPAGTMSGLRIWDWNEAGVPVPDPDPPPSPTLPAPTVPITEPCCGTGTPNPSPGSGPVPIPGTPEWYRSCVGGGAVPSVPDLTDAEYWDF